MGKTKRQLMKTVGVSIGAVGANSMVSAGRAVTGEQGEGENENPEQAVLKETDNYKIIPLYIKMKKNILKYILPETEREKSSRWTTGQTEWGHRVSQ